MAIGSPPSDVTNGGCGQPPLGLWDILFQSIKIKLTIFFKNVNYKKISHWLKYVGPVHGVFGRDCLMIEYKKTRSKFWLKIFDDEATHTNISANKMVMGLLQEISPHLISCSPKGWKESSNIPGNYNLWIPNDRMDWEALENVETWAERANQHIWLGTNKNTAPYFCGDEVDYCLAADWNIDLESQKRTIIGEAEYQLKYNLPKELINKEDAHQYASLLTTAVLDCIACLPINLSNFVVVSIPATEEKQKN